MNSPEIVEKVLSLSGIDLRTLEQGSDDWTRVKLGVLSASNADKILAGRTTATRQTYMAELVAQVCTGERPEINAKQMEWGKENEASARLAYELANDCCVHPVGFVFKNESLRVGCSPDGIITGTGLDPYKIPRTIPLRGLELKCPFTTKVFIEFLTADKIKPEYIKQCQMSMWIMDYESWAFANYDRRMRKNNLVGSVIMRDSEMMKKFDDAVPEFLCDMDEMLERAGFKFGDQWEIRPDELQHMSSPDLETQSQTLN